VNHKVLDVPVVAYLEVLDVFLVLAQHNGGLVP